MILTKEVLQQIAPVPSAVADKYLPYINQHMGDVNTPLRFAAFLANVLHESMCFHYTQEIASGDAYEGNVKLGNTQKGDGRKFKGHGLIQVTGRANHAKLSHDLFGDDRLLNTPELIATDPELAVRSAYWFWNTNKLNAIADIPDFEKVVRRINGGTNGLAERQKYYNKALQLLS